MAEVSVPVGGFSLVPPTGTIPSKFPLTDHGRDQLHFLLVCVYFSDIVAKLPIPLDPEEYA